MIRIKKAKLNSVANMEIDYEESSVNTEGERITFEITKKCLYPPHNDLLLTIDALKPFVAELCELIEGDCNEDNPVLSKIKVTGYVIGGADEHEGVTIIARKQLAHNKVLNLVTPFTKWVDEHNGYDKSYQMASAIRECDDEVMKYLDGKQAPKAQMEIEFEQ